MDIKKRILVVEDQKSERETYVDYLELDGYDVDAASNLGEALAAINNRTYHVALVDIMLAGPEDRENRDGLEVLQRLQELREGTKAIVLSGQPAKKDVHDMWKDYGISDYIFKIEDIAVGGPGVMAAKVADALQECTINEYGRHAGVVDLLAGQKNEGIWVSKFLTTLRPKGGFESLQRFLENLCSRYLPLIPHKDSLSCPAQVDEERGVVNGFFWSKATGTPLELLVCGTPKTGDSSSEALHRAVLRDINQNDLLYRHEKSALIGLFLKATGAARGDFAECI